MSRELNLKEFVENATYVAKNAKDMHDGFHEGLRNMNKERERQKKLEEEERQRAFNDAQTLLDQMGSHLVQ